MRHIAKTLALLLACLLTPWDGAELEAGGIYHGGEVQSIGAIGHGGVPQSLDSVSAFANWASRDSCTSDGAWMQLSDTDAIYQCSTTVGEWVRPFVYAGTIVVDAVIDGDVTPANEAGAWDDSNVGGSSPGTITSNGTIVTWDGFGNNDDFCWSSFTPGAASADYFMLGSFQSLNIAGANGSARLVGINTANGGKLVYVTIEDSGTTRVGFLDAAGATTGCVLVNHDAGAAEIYLEVYVWNNQGGLIFVDNEAFPSAAAQWSQFPASGAAEEFLIGDATSGAQGEMTGRNIIVGRFKPGSHKRMKDAA